MISILKMSKSNIGYYLDAILEIEKVSFPSPWSRISFERETENPLALMYALLLEEMLTGYICFWHVDKEIHLMNLAVHPEKRCRGFGRVLLERMFEKGINKGAQKAWLEVRPSNTAAIRLYRKAGFQKAGMRPRYYRDTNEDAIIMALNLPANSYEESKSFRR